MEPTLELSGKAYVNVKWEENAAAGELVSTLIYQLAIYQLAIIGLFKIKMLPADSGIE